MHFLSRAALVATTLLGATANAQYYKIGNTAQIKESARTLAYDMMLFYHGNESGQIPGILPGPPADGKGDYYWYHGGAMMGTYIDYWHLTGDTSYNSVVMQGMQFQVGEDQNYQPRNWTASLGNDDQAFWGMAAMLAAENKFPNPPSDRPQWLALAQAVWNAQNRPDRHDKECGGGMRWQIPPFNGGYDYKNTIANACFMNIGARLARYTNNDTYSRIAEETWDWMWSVKYIDHEKWLVYDGGHVEKQCTDVQKATFTANAVVLIQAVAFMYSHTKDEKWYTRLDNLLTAYLANGFLDGAAFEPNCEPGRTCNADMLAFKGYAHRWLSVVMQLVPKTEEKIAPMLKSSVEAAVAQCTGGPTGRKCGFYWSTRKFSDPAADKTSGACEAMNVLGAVSSMLIKDADPPATAANGGISQGDVNAGNGGQFHLKGEFKPITTADKAGAGIVTCLLVGSAIGLFIWMAM